MVNESHCAHFVEKLRMPCEEVIRIRLPDFSEFCVKVDKLQEIKDFLENTWEIASNLIHLKKVVNIWILFLNFWDVITELRGIDIPPSLNVRNVE